ncbi:MAG: IS1182 family transposase [Proteobacteria bacterium]|nr:IS1182 family transposase [Pseudomonadota bacterium]
MIGRKNREQRTLFIAGDIEQFIPEDHILKRVDRILDLTWLREEVRECYCEDNGRPGIDPEAAVRLMLAGFFHGIVHDRKLMREAQVHLAIRWFAGYSLEDELPDHSSLSRIRQRWGVERFKKIFQRSVKACIEKGLVSGETVHIDATLIRADVSWESITERHAETVVAENEAEEDTGSNNLQARRPGRPRTREGYPKKVSMTDPDATLVTSRGDFHLEPSYKQHTSVDDKAGVIVDVDLTTGEDNEGQRLIETIDRIEDTTGRKLQQVTADASYAHARNYEELERRGIDAIIPPQRERSKEKRIPIRRFKYDGKHQVVKCPGGKILGRTGQRANGWVYSARKSDCEQCRLRERCLPETAHRRVILIVEGYEALLRARRRKLLGWDNDTQRVYGRHRFRVEGTHGEAKTQHGLRQAIRRGLVNVAIQVYLIAAVINWKRLARDGTISYPSSWHSRQVSRLIYCIVSTIQENLNLRMVQFIL